MVSGEREESVESVESLVRVLEEGSNQDDAGYEARVGAAPAQADQALEQISEREASAERERAQVALHEAMCLARGDAHAAEHQALLGAAQPRGLAA